MAGADSTFGRLPSKMCGSKRAFASGDILSLSRGRRDAGTYDLIYSGMTGDLLAERGA